MAFDSAVPVPDGTIIPRIRHTEYTHNVYYVKYGVEVKGTPISPLDPHPTSLRALVHTNQIRLI